MLGLRYLCPASDEVGGGESSQRTSLPENWNQFLRLMLKVGLRGHPSDEDEDLWKDQDQESISPFEERPRKTGHSFSTHPEICVVVSVPEGLANFGTRHQ